MKKQHLKLVKGQKINPKKVEGNNKHKRKTYQNKNQIIITAHRLSQTIFRTTCGIYRHLRILKKFCRDN